MKYFRWIACCIYALVLSEPVISAATPVDPLIVVFEGERASSNLGIALIHLRYHYRSLVIDRKPELHDGFWLPAIAAEAWPAQAFQPEDVAKAYIMEWRQKKPLYAIPKIKVTTIPGRIRASAPEISLDAREVSPEDAKKICAKYPPTPTELDKNTTCVVALISNVGVFSERKVSGAKPDSVVREVILEIGAYALVINSISSVAQRKILAQQLETIAHGRIPPDPQNYQHRTGSSGDKPDLQSDCLKTTKAFADALDSQRRLSQWPQGEDRSVTHARLVVADPDVEEVIYWTEREEPPKSIEQRIKHPYLVASAGKQPVRVNCSALLQSGEGVSKQPWQHAVGVASAVFGASETRIGEGTAERTISGILEPKDKVINYSPIYRWQVGNIPRKSVIVAAFDNTISEPIKTSISEQISNKNTGQGAFNPVVTGAAVIVAAPLLRDNPSKTQNYFEIDNALWRTGKTMCIDWPACLGASPFALVVAPLDNKGSLMEVEPATDKKYRLESTVTALAAPGQDIVTVATDSNGTWQLALQSGSSLAVASVAAVALKLLERGLPISSGIELMARIAATSDLTLVSPEQVRFGRLNATRALLDGGRNYVFPLTNLETNDIQSIAESEACLIEGGIYNRCSNQDKAPEGSLIFYKEGDAQSTPTCVSVHRLLRIRKTGANDSGDPLYTIVYYKDGTEKFKVLYPHIERGIRIGSWSDIHECQESNGQLDAPDANKRPCLTRRNNEGGVKAIDLTKSDIVFNAWQIDATAERPKCGPL